MTRLISLLSQKNHYLEKFYSINEAELARFAVGDFDHVEIFYQNRERILEIVRYLDQEFETLNKGLPESASLTVDERRDITQALKEKDQFVEQILNQDLEILSYIEKAKSDIIRELQSLGHSKKAVSSYRSRNFNRRLDEEA